MSEQDKEVGELKGRISGAERQIELYRQSLDSFQAQLGSMSVRIETRLDSSAEKILLKLESKADVAQLIHIEERLNSFETEAKKNFQSLNNSKLIWNTKTKIFMALFLGVGSIFMSIFSLITAKIIDYYFSR